jgi:poly-gamma-glutamate capsule biosynthesis protein CapA/YwtB (metallophosphatase superfamily)
MAGCASTPAPETPPPAAEPAEEVETAPAPQGRTGPVAPEPDRSQMRITVAAVGDMMLGTDYPENRLPDDDGVGFLADVAPILASADITFGNLEGVLLDGGEPGKKCSNPNACYLFRSPSRYVEHYRAAGFDVMSLANNHARDFGEEGRIASMRTLADAGIRHSGLEGDFASFSVNGLKVAVMAYAVTRNSNMLLDYDLAKATVAGYAGTHDIVIVSFHGGAEGRDVSNLPFDEEEYFDEPRGDVVRFARMMVDAGADLVVGHGPHVIRAMENYRGRLIAYSLGNFATYYGISVAGIRGIAPILQVTLDGEGNFVEGRIHSTRQLRPAGPSIDPENRALIMLRGLSREDFGSPGIRFLDDGTIQPAPRQSVRPLADTF